jgi:drug/metabolite transporter (DMT)-like permease
LARSASPAVKATHLLVHRYLSRYHHRKRFIVASPVPAAAQYRASLLAVWSALSAVYLIWGSTYLAIRYAVETTPPFLMAAVRFMLSGGCLYAARRLTGDPPPHLVEWRSASIVGILLLLGGNGGVVWAEQFIPSGLAALLVATVPLWMVLFDTLGSDAQKPGFTVMIGILIGFAGVALLIGSVATDMIGARTFGAAALVFASLSWATGSLYGRNAALPASPLLGTGMEMLAGGIALLFLGLVVGEWNQFSLNAVSLRSALALVYLTVIGSGAFVAYVWLLRVAPTPLVATYAYVNPLVAVLLGHFLAHETLNLRTGIAAALIIGSVVTVSTAKR